MSNPYKFHSLDQQVIKAWRSRTFSDGSKIQLNSDKEQGFIVKPDAILEVQTKRQQIIKCNRGKEVVVTRFNPSVFAGYAGGHTHPKGTETFPGPLDSQIAKLLFASQKLSYVISIKGAYAIEYTGNTYLIRTISGKIMSERRIKRQIKIWLKQKPRAAFRSEKDFICQ